MCMCVLVCVGVDVTAWCRSRAVKMMLCRKGKTPSTGAVVVVVFFSF